MSYSSEIIQNALNQTQVSLPTGMSMMLSTPYGFVPCYIPALPQVIPETSVTDNSTQVSADAWRHNISNLNNSIRPSVPVTPAQHPSKKRNNNRNLTVYGIVDLYKFSSKDYYFFYENVRSVGAREVSLSSREFRIHNEGIRYRNNDEFRYGGYRCGFLRLIEIIQECDPLAKFILSPYPTKDGKRVIVCTRNNTINGYINVMNQKDRVAMLGDSKTGYFCLQKRKIVPY
jgi:hypothetical protein